MDKAENGWSDAAVLALRGPKAGARAERANGAFVEPERMADGRVAPVATVLLAGRECPLRCVMCDLWRGTLEGPTPVGALPGQLREALRGLPAARGVKLYNASNFFDPLAVPVEDWEAIARLVDRFELVVVENHPRFGGRRCGEFRSLIRGELEVAIGLETTHGPTLARLNKRMTVEEARRAAEELVAGGIAVRVFVLLRPPWTSEAEGIERAVRTCEEAVRWGARVCSIIPVRGGNGAMERLELEGVFAPPELESLERAQALALRSVGAQARVFADLWDVERLARCGDCFAARKERLQRMNLEQVVLPAIQCERCDAVERGRG